MLPPGIIADATKQHGGINLSAFWAVARYGIVVALYMYAPLNVESERRMVSMVAASGLTDRQRAIGQRIHDMTEASDVRTTMEQAVELWLTMDPFRDLRERPLRPRPIDRREEPNNETEDMALLAATYQAYCPTAKPIRPAMFNLDDPIATGWYMLLKSVKQIPDDDLGYLDSLIVKASDGGPHEKTETGVAPRKDQVDERYVFQNQGDFYRVVFDGVQLEPIASCVGMKYIEHLLKNPEKPINVSDLKNVVNLMPGLPASSDTLADYSGDDTGVGRTGIAGGEAVDMTTMKEVRAKIVKLQGGLRDEKLDPEERQRLQSERDRLNQYLNQSVNYHGRSRKMAGDRGENDRSSVTQAINRARKGIKDPALKTHLEYITTGSTCAYLPKGCTRDWTFF